MMSDEQAEVPDLAFISTQRQPPSGIDLSINLLDSAPPPPPSPEKTRRADDTRRRLRPSQQQMKDEAATRGSESARIELEVEELLDNSKRWRRERHLRIRTPVRRVLLQGDYYYGTGPTGTCTGRRCAVLSDLSARVREMEIDDLSRGIVCAVAMQKTADVNGSDKAADERVETSEAARAEAVGSARLDPRVRRVYREIMPVRRAKTIAAALQTESSPSGAKATAKPAAEHEASSQLSNPRDGRLQTSQTTRSQRQKSLRSRDGNDTTDSSAYRPVRRVKTSVTTVSGAGRRSQLAGSSNIARFQLYQSRQINGEIQRSLYLEPTHELRRLLHPECGQDNYPLLRGLVGIGSGVRR